MKRKEEKKDMVIYRLDFVVNVISFSYTCDFGLIFTLMPARLRADVDCL